ncbi:MAG: membrane protein insertase YidC [Deltaproteobacteria bacterium]|nr:membrane protein insertase YidC [Deltaproteobacteria bacterium]
MDKKTILAFTLSFVVLVGWSLFFSPEPKQAPIKKDATAQNIQPVAGDGKSPVSVTAVPSAKPVTAVGQPGHQVAEKRIEIDTPLYKVVFSNVGPTIKSFKLKKYRQTTDPDSPYVELVTLEQGMGDYLTIEFDDNTVGNVNHKTFSVDKDSLTLNQDSEPATIVFQGTRQNGIAITQTYRFFPDRYGIDLAVTATNPTTTPVNGVFRTTLRSVPPNDKGSYYAYVGFALLLDDSLDEIEVEDPGEEKSARGKIGWFAYEDNYFISAIVPVIPTKGAFTGKHLSSGVMEGVFLPPAVSLPVSAQATSEYQLYIGPRDLEVLKEFGKNLDQAINFGWTDIIAKPLLYTLHFFDQYIHNYGLSIILLTILVKILFWPLTHKSYKSMKEMQKLQPRMAKLREKYKGDKQKLNQEMMGLYKTYKVNPMGGCLPMVVQIPVFFALFRVLGACIELRHAPFVFWINDLSAPDRLFHFSFQIPFMTPPYGIPVLTLLMGGSMFIQQKMTPTPGDPTQAKIMMFLPVIFTFMFINFPSGLVLYWLVNNLLSIGQQYRIYKQPA